MKENTLYGWEKEVEGLSVSDQRLKKRFAKILDDLSSSPAQSIFLASGTRNEAKAVYRFLSNEDVDKNQILKSAKQATVARIKECGESTILAVQDTTSISFGNREKIDGMGYYCQSEQKGMLTHSAIAVTTDGIPLGLLHQQYHTRDTKSDHEISREEKKYRTIEEKESYQWLVTMEEARKEVGREITLIHVCDREGDIYELFDLAQKKEELFLVRIVQNRLTEDNNKLKDALKQESPQGTLLVNIARNTKNNIPDRKVLMNFAYQKYEIKCPKSRKEDHLAKRIEITGIYVWEKGVPEEKAIHWFLITNASVKDTDEAIAIIGYYTQRWKIERFHYVLKSGGGIEKKQIRTYEKLCMLTMIYSLIALRILNLTYIGRIAPNLPCSLLLEEEEWKLLYCIAQKTRQCPDKPYGLGEAIKYVGILGGFSGAPSDGLPGVKVIWLGLEKLLFALSCREFLV